MKTIQLHYKKVANAILFALLTLFGFSNCEPTYKYGAPSPVPEYGTPAAQFETKNVDVELIENADEKI
ncbi:MAG: hypothetical protein FWC39_01840 [Bacteroidetes bacterium]|nr:hypothetical protein [Bacteroidota bacterium]